MSEPMITGTVKWFNATKGYGFLATSSHGDLFVHVSALADGCTTLHTGDHVICGVQPGKKDVEACDVRVTDPAPVPPVTAAPVERSATSAIAAEIATELGETTNWARQQIRQIVERVGVEAARALLTQTREVEAAGGMLLPDGSRRRTPGGVFFALVKASLSPTDRAVLFPPFGRKAKARGAGQGAASSTATRTPSFTWADRIAAIQQLGENKGEIRTVKVTLIGRPGKVIEKKDVVLTSMQSAKTPALPKGLPTPPATPTTYVVYIARKQWAGVAEAIQNPEDTLIIEGWAAYDAELEGVAVFVLFPVLGTLLFIYLVSYATASLSSIFTAYSSSVS